MQLFFSCNPNKSKHKRMVSNGPHDFVGYFFAEADSNKNKIIFLFAFRKVNFSQYPSKKNWPFNFSRALIYNRGKKPVLTTENLAKTNLIS